MNPEIFGWEHLTFLAIFVVFMILCLVLFKIYAKSRQVQDIIVRSVGLLLFIFILWNRIAICISNHDASHIIPDTFCGMSGLVLALAVIFGKRDNNVLHFVFYFAILGGFITMIYPDFIGQSSSIFYSNTISGLLHHSFSFFLCLLLCVAGWFHPNIKKWSNVAIGFMAYITVGAFLMSVFGYDDAFYIMHPILSGTPLTVWVLIPVFAVLYFGFMGIYEIVRRKIHKPGNDETYSKIQKVLNEKF